MPGEIRTSRSQLESLADSKVVTGFMRIVQAMGTVILAVVVYIALDFKGEVEKRQDEIKASVKSLNDGVQRVERKLERIDQHTLDSDRRIERLERRSNAPFAPMLPGTPLERGG